MNKPVAQIERWSNKVVQIWPNAFRAAKALGYDNTNLYLNLEGKRNHAYGFIWKYLTPKVEELTGYCQKCGNKEHEMFRVCEECL